MILTAALMHGLGAEFGAWRVREGDASDYVSSKFYLDIARLGEAGKLHGLFLAEQMTNKDTGTQRPCGAMDTGIVLSHMAAVTSRIGLVGTGSTTYNQPYELARRFGTLDNLSGGRTGWNAVTTANPATAEMFGGSGLDTHPDATARYDRGDEFIDVVGQLWDSWGEDASSATRSPGCSRGPSWCTRSTSSASTSPCAARCRSRAVRRGARSSSTPARRPPAGTRRPGWPT